MTGRSSPIQPLHHGQETPASLRNDDATTAGHDNSPRGSDYNHEPKLEHVDSGSKNSQMQDPAQAAPGTELKPVVEVEAAPEVVEKFHKLSWPRLTIVLIVEAIALGSLSMPSTFASIGMIGGVILTVGMGFVAIYSSLHIGNLWLKHPELTNYPLAGELLFGKMFGPRMRRPGYYFTTGCFLLLLTFTTGSHSLTGRTAFETLSDNGLCAAGWAGISAVILFLIALPKTFNEMAWLGFLDFGSIITAILITMIAAGVQNASKPGGLGAVEWYAILPAEQRPSFTDAFQSVTNVVFAYAYAQCQFSFMTELKNPKDFNKSIWLLGGIEIVIYTLTGALIYAFVGTDVSSPALLSTSGVVPKVAFGIALPVIFISGSINTTTAARFIYDSKYQHTRHQYINTVKGNIVWIALTLFITIIAFVLGEVIPIFNALLGIISALFISFFSYIFPPLFWIFLLREGDWKKGKNLWLTLLNGLIAVCGFFILVAGVYSSAIDIRDAYRDGTAGTPFSCTLPPS